MPQLSAKPIARFRAPGAMMGQRPVAEYAIDRTSLALAATSASVAITIYMMLIPRWLGMESMDIGITIGALLAPAGGVGALLGRLSWHLGNGIAYVPFYAAVLLLLRRQSKVGTGLVFGIILWLLGPMLLIPVLLERYPAVASGSLTNPGVFMLDLGRGWTPAAVDLLAHLVSGGLAGMVYKHRSA